MISEGSCLSNLAKKADIKVVDRGENISAMEPLLVRESSRFRNELADLALDLTAKSTALRKSLPDGVVSALSDLVRSMNCYYSNLIEGHDTHPVDIERAINEDYSADPEQRDLQLEAKAHIAVQQWIDEAVLYRGELPRGEVAGLLSTGDRNARRVSSALVDCGALQSKSIRSPLVLHFPAAFASQWMPGLFPDENS